MSVGYMDDVRQTAVIDEAEQLANRYLLPEFADVRALYAAIGFDALAFAHTLSGLAATARDARNEAAAERAGYEAGSADVRAVVPDCATWLEKLRTAGRFGRSRKLALGQKIENLVTNREFSPTSWSQARDAVGAGLAVLRDADLVSVGLTADFVARGRELFATLERERTEQSIPWKDGSKHTDALHAALAAIQERFEEVIAARDHAMAMTGKRIPGLELTLIKGAAATSSRPAPDAPSPATPAGETGL